MTSYTKNLATPSPRPEPGTRTEPGTRLAQGAGALTSVKVAAIPLRVGGVILGLVQFAFAFLAAWDLAQRDADDVRGPKLAWVPALFINWIGPAAYFLFGIRHSRR
ncbi:PLDc_N domain-containing protein [Microbacterium sp. 4R-513]|uniref:PLD nuclease N-terminal domain-containing protein n=1 Tax=Microbacterium sp. 4R-513 TaxID=2567934 RepID=UPI0013E1887F|nr:PLD nuclease N-terminal domain-containing protein [Microbacterium sp. 4R-513]QIG40343.1 PLDc_N domain-containing protein [Microbacterium sp. 4R-513]